MTSALRFVYVEGAMLLTGAEKWYQTEDSVTITPSTGELATYLNCTGKTNPGHTLILF